MSDHQYMTVPVSSSAQSPNGGRGGETELVSFSSASGNGTKNSHGGYRDDPNGTAGSQIDDIDRTSMLSRSGSTDDDTVDSIDIIMEQQRRQYNPAYAVVCFLGTAIFVLLLAISVHYIRQPGYNSSGGGSGTSGSSIMKTQGKAINATSKSHGKDYDLLEKEKESQGTKQVLDEEDLRVIPTILDVSSIPSKWDVDHKELQFEVISDLSRTKIQNYKNGTGLIINVHVTHHAGTTVCGTLGLALGRNMTPSFVCMSINHAKNGRENEDAFMTPEDFKSFPNFVLGRGEPWRYNETADNIAKTRKYFHFVSWEFPHPSEHVHLNDTNWEDPNIVSLFVARDPLSQLLAADGRTNHKYPKLKTENSTLQMWWEFAKDDAYTDNYALRSIAGNGCCDGADTDPSHLEMAKSILRRMTFVVDIQCLDDSIDAIKEILGLPDKYQRLLQTELWNFVDALQEQDYQKDSQEQYFDSRDLSKSHSHPPSEERIPYHEVYEYLKRKNRLSIDLYEWASEHRALVNCKALQQSREEQGARA